MRTKNDDIRLKNLNPVFDIPLKKFDKLHTELMGNQAVVTSVDTGKHWGSIKKENRPDDWELMSVKEVKIYSDSKHFDEPLCNALDFRRRCPYGDMNYYDDLTKSQQRYFMVEIYKCFPDDRFDVVFSRLCLHVEHDPERRKHTPKIKLKDRAKKLIDSLYPTKRKKPIEMVKLPAYKKSGFKRVAGVVTGIIGLALKLFPETAIAGELVMYAGGALGIVGTGHGMVKNRKKDGETKIDKIAILRWIADLLIKYLTRKKERS